MRTLRKSIDIGLPLLGVAVILVAVLFARGDLRLQLAIVGVGMVLLELGVWKAAHRILPTGRRYLALRVESDLFMQLVRQLNTAALAKKQNGSQAFEEVRDAMRQSVERMAEVAGKTNAELTPASAGPNMARLPAETGSGTG
ncbi:MAG: hypothetical protein V3V96_01935 [Acidiferrobacterales bacterium]